MDSIAARSTSGLPRRPRPVSTLTYPFEPPAADGSVVEIAPGILWARMPMPMTLDHINVYLLRDRTGWVIVDTGLNTPRAREVWETIAADKLDGLPIQAVLCTHFHYDHAGLAHWLTERFDVPLYMTYGEYYAMRVTYTPLPDPLPPTHLAHFHRSGLSDEMRDAIIQGLRRDPFTPPAAMSFCRLAQGQMLTIGQRKWRVVIGSGHSPEHACLYCEEEKLLIAGDQLLPRISSNVQVTAVEPEANPLADWLASLDHLDQLDAQTLVLPSHQGVFHGLRTRVQELREHHAQQLGQLGKFVAEHPDATAFDAMREMFPQVRAPIDHLLALGETIAHLAWLREAGEIVRDLNDNGVYVHRMSGVRASAGKGAPRGIRQSRTTGDTP
ncbi:Zn-dependent hydrolase [Pandoraea terrae]|uniref:Zn-dependent hydrolase n=1 Tax=Pandoraea terrae TaxID=1537710 RepID=A0A5E4YWH3_9BURK|nr:MBL fold metallo-hydrolase [Pandoraea terrae]VVE52470.1 Zn-dependent hydrolase [Pandoraea terrae]